MKAVVYNRYGPPEVLHTGDVPSPEPGKGEIRIRIRAAEVTKGDCEMRKLRFPVSWFALPMRLVMGWRRPKRKVLGGYFAGEIDKLGPGVTGFAPGDRVYGSTRLRLGAYGQYQCLPADYTIMPMPANLDFEAAAAVPLGGLNALHFMNLACIQAGDEVLINGAGGSIGTFAVQIAKDRGARVTAVDNSRKADMLHDLGADRVLDYARVEVTAEPHRYDVVFNMVAGASFAGMRDLLKPGGRYLIGNPTLSDMIQSLWTTATTDKTASFALARETRAELTELTRLIEASQLAPRIDRIFPMDEAAEAHRRVESEERLGIVVLRLDDPA